MEQAQAGAAAAVAGHGGRFDAIDQAVGGINNQVIAAVDARLVDGDGDNRLEVLGQQLVAANNQLLDIKKLKEYSIDAVVHGAGATIVGEYVKAFAHKYPEQLAKSPLDEEHTNKGLELIGSFAWDATFKVIQERKRATVATAANVEEHAAAVAALQQGEAPPAAAVVVNPNYPTQAYDALKNGEASFMIIIGKFILAKAGEMAGLPEDEIKPWEKLSPSVQWVVGCVLHSLVRDQITQVQGG